MPKIEEDPKLNSSSPIQTFFSDFLCCKSKSTKDCIFPTTGVPINGNLKQDILFFYAFNFLYIFPTTGVPINGNLKQDIFFTRLIFCTFFPSPVSQLTENLKKDILLF